MQRRPASPPTPLNTESSVVGLMGPPVPAHLARRAALVRLSGKPDPGHVPRLALLARLAAADGNEGPVAVARVGDVGPAEGAHLASPHPGHEEESRDHGVEPAAGRLSRTRRRGRAGEGDGRWRGRRPGLLPRTPASARGRGLRRSAGSPRGPGRCVPRPGSALRQGGPGSTPRPPPSRRLPGLGPGRGVRRGRRRGSHPRAGGHRARRRAGGAPRSTPGCSGRGRPRRGGGRSAAGARGRRDGAARESIFTTADVRSTCRRLRRPGPRSG